ncbi:glycine zipper 2TM domain-containing protein [Paenalcaligenes niemegkensis]|uniref:glycine zipper 2TM domain-containing protein n=1 Tax=Paenalcaligenes niemegkensis TaxID=2895469 RepID=UPI001EE7A0F2|nr:glycine zipper 2TM domain-containing protein [Paenalcaligenes niemegkensis]MCQ9615455.1 glycine zipper 2TM domain-containing protein [Paenalcaligenes niemegkensis]
MQTAARRFAIVALAVSPLVFIAGCANKSASSNVYSYGQAQREQIVRMGTVVSTRAIVIQNEQSSGVGTVAGGALGGVAGSSIGGGRGQILATIGGALLGGLAGTAVENQTGKTQGLEVTVRLDNGETRVIAQAADIQFTSGQRVRLLSGNGPTRVVPL